MSTELPNGWQACTLGTAFQWGSGGTPKRSSSAYYGGEIPWAIIGDLNDGLVTNTASSISKRGLAESSAKWLPEGSVLLAMYGSIGKLGIAGIPLTTNQAIAFTTPVHVPPKYLFYYLMHVKPDLTDRGKGGTQQNISQTVIKAFPFLAAPLPEQHRIVEAIESYLTRLDDAVATLERVQRNLRRYRASVLKAAVEGRLVPTEAELARTEGRDYEPASVLLDRILAERRRRWEEAELAKMKAKGKPPKNDKWKAKYKEPAGPDTTDLPELPEGWCWASMYQVGDVIAGYGFPKPLQGRTSGDYPFFKVGDISRAAQEGRQHLGAARHYVTNADLTLLKARPLAPGTTVFAKIGAAIALNRRAMLSQPSLVDNNVFGVRPVPEVESEYLYYLLSKMAFGKDARATTVPSLRKDDVGLRPVPLPPTAEQARIVEALAKATTTEHHLRSLAAVNSKRAGRLRQAILKWAFEGKLADQDPNDEPAAALLERIRAERAKTTTKKTNGRGRTKRGKA